jgi:hypothetical protein
MSEPHFPYDFEESQDKFVAVAHLETIAPCKDENIFQVWYDQLYLLFVVQRLD